MYFSGLPGENVANSGDSIGATLVGGEMNPKVQFSGQIPADSNFAIYFAFIDAVNGLFDASSTSYRSAFIALNTFFIILSYELSSSSRGPDPSIFTSNHFYMAFYRVYYPLLPSRDSINMF